MKDILITLIIQSATLFGLYLRWRWDLKKERLENELKIKAIGNLSPRRGIVNKDAFNSDARRLLVDGNIDRILLLEVTNGGGLINMLSPMYVNCLDEIITKKVKPIKHFIQKFQTDSHYNALLSQLVKMEKLQLVTAHIDEPSSIIRNIYEGSGVLFTEWFLLGEMRGANQKIYFMTIGSITASEFTKEEQLDIDLFINKYRNETREAIAETLLTKP